MFDEQTLELMTGLSRIQRTALGELYARLDESAKIEVHQRQRELYKERVALGMVSSPGRSDDLDGYAAFLAVLKQLWMDQAPAVTGLVREHKPYKKRLRTTLEKKYMLELLRLRDEEQLSWRQLSEYFKQQFKKTVSHTYLKRIYEEYKAAT